MDNRALQFHHGQDNSDYRCAKAQHEQARADDLNKQDNFSQGQGPRQQLESCYRNARTSERETKQKKSRSLPAIWIIGIEHTHTAH